MACNASELNFLRRYAGQPRMSNPYHSTNPANAGWTYQGHNAQSRVEYYAKDGVKMDYYPTTGESSHSFFIKSISGRHEFAQCLLLESFLKSSCCKVHIINAIVSCHQFSSNIDLRQYRYHHACC